MRVCVTDNACHDDNNDDGVDDISHSDNNNIGDDVNDEFNCSDKGEGGA